MNIALSVFRRTTVLFAGRRGRGGHGRGDTPHSNYNSMSWASSSEKSDMELSEEEFPPPSSCSLRASSVAYRWMYSGRDAQSGSELDKVVPHHINWDLKPLTQPQSGCVTCFFSQSSRISLLCHFKVY